MLEVPTPTPRWNAHGARRAGASGARRGPRRHERDDHRPVRASLDAQRSGDRRRGTDPARRRRLCLGVDAGRRPRRGVLRPRPRLGRTTRRPIRSPTPSSTSASSASPAAGHAVLLLRGDRSGGRTTVDRRRRRHRRRAARSSTSALLCGATDPAGTSFAVFQPAPGIARPELNGAGPGELSYITYEVRGLGGVQGVLQRAAVLDVRARSHRRRLAGAGHSSDGRRRGRRAPAM